MLMQERWCVKKGSGIQWVKRIIGTRQCQKENDPPLISRHLFLVCLFQTVFACMSLNHLLLMLMILSLFLPSLALYHLPVFKIGLDLTMRFLLIVRSSGKRKVVRRLRNCSAFAKLQRQNLLIVSLFYHWMTRDHSS